jgi:hypothetical protein
MNIYDFFHSPDIAAHCKKINHVFSPLDMAIIVALSDKPLKEKHAAYRHIIAEYPDMPIHENRNFKAQPSLREYLRGLIERDEREIEAFLTPEEGAFYRLRVQFRLCEEAREPIEAWNPPCFSSFDKIKQHFSSAGWKGDRITEICVDKEYIDENNKKQTVEINYDSEILVVLGSRLNKLESIFFHLPVPFERGDLVTTDGITPLVLKRMPHLGVSDEKFTYEDFVAGKNGAGSDMSAGVYQFDSHSELAYACICYGLYSLQYFNGELEGQERFLKYLSQYIKTKDDRIDWLIAVYCKFKTEAEHEYWNGLFGGWYKKLEEE